MDKFVQTLNIVWLVLLTIGHHWQDIAIKSSCTSCESFNHDHGPTFATTTQQRIRQTSSNVVTQTDIVSGGEIIFGPNPNPESGFVSTEAQKHMEQASASTNAFENSNIDSDDEFSFDLTFEDETSDAAPVDGYLLHQSDSRMYEPNISNKKQVIYHDSHHYLHAEEKDEYMYPKQDKKEFEDNEMRKLSSESYYHTSCALVESLDLHVVERNTTVKNSTIDKSNEILTTFPLQFKLKTDSKPDGISWALLAHDDNNEDNVILDSSQNTVTEELSSPHTLHEFNYFCTVLSDKLMYNKENAEPICYNWKIFDEKKDGFCCNHGPGYFELKINNDKNHIITDRLFSYELSSSFCINNVGDVVDKEEEKIQNVSSFPSRECIKNECICDSNPVLLGSFDKTSSMYDTIMRVMGQMVRLSGIDKLMDITSAQYKGACWVLLDDPYFYEHNNNTTFNVLERIEERMIQRYILAVFFFSTTPKNWTRSYHFLSSRSECEWNSKEEFYANNTIKTLSGILCDDDENIFSILFHRDNLGGTIIDEIHGLKKLEVFAVRHNKNLYGTIPSSLGRLSELRQLFLFQNSLSGSIPKELTKATKMQLLHLGQNQLTGNLPKGIENLKKLSRLSVYQNNLSGELPEELYMLKDLVRLDIYQNGFISSISTMIGSMTNLRYLSFNDNLLTGEIPSSITQLSRLEELHLNNNTFSGSPDFSTFLPNLSEITLHDNNFNGTISDSVCNTKPDITADCRNDIFTPSVSCSCCVYCRDQTPLWGGKCADNVISIKIDHQPIKDHSSNSDDLKWSLKDNSVDSQILYDGPYEKRDYSNIITDYQTCVGGSGCFSLIMESPPKNDTNYTVYWNDYELMHRGTFLGYEENDDVSQNETKTIVLKHQNATCEDVKINCDGEKISILKNTSKRRMYNAAVKISGSSKLQNNTSAQLRAFCWIITHNDDEDSMHHIADDNTLEDRFTQRYTLTILHLMSLSGVFSSTPYTFPPLNHECSWTGIMCSENVTVTNISLSPKENQIISGTLIEEIGSLAYLEVLELNQMQLEGSIPDVLSNLYSLRKLDLSMNNLTTSIPANFFNELKMLEVLDLSKNDMTGLIPENIGLHSDMSVIALSGNSFTGLLPLDNFSSHNLIYLDVSDNQFSGNISSSLLKHTRLEHLYLGNNLFVGTLGEYLLHDLSNLRYLDVSNNELIGLIPAVHNNKESNMIRFDISANRFIGTLPSSITHMSKAEHLNLQGNKITGVIPNGINDLKELKTLALSHNALKGSIPLNLTQFTNLSKLYLHGNQLTGKAPDTKSEMDYVTDCGFPSTSLERITCPSCNICCNAENLCAEKPRSVLQPPVLGVIFFVIVAGFMTLVYKAKDRIIRMKSLKQHFEKVSTLVATDIIGEKSVYHFFLTQNTYGWYSGLFCAVAQLFTLFLFLRAADISNHSSDLTYTMTCPRNSLECTDDKSISTHGALIFTLILGAWMLRDIIGSIKLFMLAMWKKNIDFFFASMIIFLVSIFSVWTSVFYNIATGTKDTELMVNAVILLFVNELDERLYQLAEALDPNWVSEVDETTERRSYFDRNQLLLSRGLHKIDKLFHSSVLKFSGQRNENKSDPDILAPEGIVENENIELSEDPIDLETKAQSSIFYTCRD